MAFKLIAAERLSDIGDAIREKLSVTDTYKISEMPDAILSISGGGQPYEGEYVFTPSRERQTAPTAGKSLSENIIIEAIPQNYGLITYNGFEITIS